MARFHVTMTVEAEVEISDEAMARFKSFMPSSKKGHEEALASYIMRAAVARELNKGVDGVEVISEEWDTFAEKVRPKRTVAK